MYFAFADAIMFFNMSYVFQNCVNIHLIIVNTRKCHLALKVSEQVFHFLFDIYHF